METEWRQPALSLLTFSASAEDGATKFDKVFDIIITLESLNGTYIRNKLFSRSFSMAKLYKYPVDSRPPDFSLQTFPSTPFQSWYPVASTGSIFLLLTPNSDANVESMS